MSPVEASVLYGGPPKRDKLRTLSESGGSHTLNRQRALYSKITSDMLDSDQPSMERSRRMSHDEHAENPREFVVDVEETMKLLLEHEDTDGNFQIHASDKGPKVFSLGTKQSNGYKTFEIRGTYQLSNLLQELALATDHNQKTIILSQDRLSENPVLRLSRMIRNTFWKNLTRQISKETIAIILADPKDRSREKERRIYVPEVEQEMIAYYKKVAVERPELRLMVETIPKNFDAEWVRRRNEKPGILALAMQRVLKDGQEELEGVPFVVPGARFNELYNWDSYFISLGLINDGHAHLARDILTNFIFEIKHYGKILNGNRSYYLCRSQPPFLTDLIRRVIDAWPEDSAPATTVQDQEVPSTNGNGVNGLNGVGIIEAPDSESIPPLNAKPTKFEFLRRALSAAIKEYHSLWMASPRLDERSGLSRYRPDGKGIPPETEASHFEHVLQPWAKKIGVSVNEFVEKYGEGAYHARDEMGDLVEGLDVSKLDEYFLHDRGVRESGHDTTYRFEKKCANLGTIDLCSLLYKYETDIAYLIRTYFDDSFQVSAEFGDFTESVFPFGTELPYTPDSSLDPTEVASASHSSHWYARAARRKELADHYLWHEGHGIYTDYDTVKGRQAAYDSVTCFWSMWAGMASADQAKRMMKTSLPKFELPGGLVSGTETSRGTISLSRPNRQWDYPAAWPPHQMMAWEGMQKYGYEDDAHRLAYRWLYMVTKGFVSAGGIIPEKFNALEASSNIDAEYGNQGMDFRCIPREGFGWTNASYQIGLQILTTHEKRALGALMDPESFYYGRRK